MRQVRHRGVDCTEDGEVFCYNCREPGHTFKECDQPNTRAPPIVDVKKKPCNRCKQLGHKTEDCTMCKKCKTTQHTRTTCPFMVCKICKSNQHWTEDCKKATACTNCGGPHSTRYCKAARMYP